MRITSALYASLLLIVAPTQCLAQAIIICSSPGHSNVEVVTDRFEEFGHSFNCVSGDFVVDISGCAPAGMYALHAPTGLSEPVAVVKRWQEYVDHVGGVMTNDITPTTMSFSAGSTNPGSGYSHDWTFAVDRISGKGTLNIEGEPAVEYECNQVDQQF